LIETEPYEVVGRLPDGTDYVLLFSSPINDEPWNVSGFPLVEFDDGTSSVAGITFFGTGLPTPPVSTSGKTVRIGSGDWTMTIKIYEKVIEQLGKDAADVFFASIESQAADGLPAFALSPPFRWATDHEIPAQMAVYYETFVILRGCGDLALACSSTGSVQVVPASRVVGSAVGLPDGVAVSIESGA
jgi:hypothetical protein